MRSLRCFTPLLAFLSIVFVFNTFQNVQSKTLDRKYDPVIISADALSGFESSDFAGAPIDQIYAMAYNGASQSWQMIPFQIDERDADGSYFNTDQSSGFDLNDECVFMAADAGDSAIGWINNSDSEQYQRFALKITDPLSPDKKGWVYLYRSATLSPQFNPYVHYTPAPTTDSPADTIAGVTYKIGAETTGGFFGFLSFPQVSNVDILDRQKIRVGVFLGLTISLNEESFAFVKINHRAGPVRIVKELEASLLGDTLAIPFQFFANSVDVGGDFTIPETIPSAPAAKIQNISQTFDLSPTASGMQFFSNKNLTAITIDGAMTPDATLLNTEVDTLPDINWLQFTGTQGTLINLVEISAIGDERKLAYLDNSSVDPLDTGDQMSYGEAGIQVTGDDIEGSFPLGLKSFFLEPNQPNSVGEQLAQFEKNPLSVQSDAQEFSVVSVEQDENSGVPQSFALEQNFPNPFNPTTVIQYKLPGSGPKTDRAILKVYDLLGKEVQTLVDREHAPGTYEIRWDGTNKSGAKVSSGVYIYQLKFRGFTSSQKMLLLR